MMIIYVRVWFFFFKQKTAYEMRISDWSSDVCSSDLLLCESAVILQPVAEGASADDLEAIGAQGILQGAETFRDAFEQDHAIPARGADPIQFGPPVVHPLYQARKGAMGFGIADRDLDLMPLILRSEEHTSELQSLMRISYAVICLKQKIYKQIHL